MPLETLFLFFFLIKSKLANKNYTNLDSKVIFWYMYILGDGQISMVSTYMTFSIYHSFMVIIQNPLFQLLWNIYYITIDDYSLAVETPPEFTANI
jgi:hypothetical protein